MKDNFSAGADRYKQFRPVYPQQLFDYLCSLCSRHEKAWDCGTGNGQIAYGLASRFREVIATDISAQQLEQAPRSDNIRYLQEPAGQSSAAGQSFDLIVVAQALHWFSFDDFYAEVRRTAKPGGIFAAICYNLIQSDPETDAVIHDFYHHIIGPYWDPERRYIDEGYQSIPFPFEEIETPALYMTMHWNLQQLLGYLRTWSAVRHYQAEQQEDPVLLVEAALHRAWEQRGVQLVSFPLTIRVGRV